MKPAPFEYFAPESVEEALSLLAQHGDEAKVLAGGQSLMPLLALRLATPAVVVDLNRIQSLDHLHDRGGVLCVGALARHRAVQRLDGLRSRCGMLADAIAVVGHVAIRNRGTVVGSLAHADPAAEWPALALALDAEVDVVGSKGARTVPAHSFFLSYLTSALEPDEVATEARFRLPDGRVGSSFLELARRHGDFAVTGVGALVGLSDDGTIEGARLVVIGAGATPLRIGDAERALLGEKPSSGAFEEAARVVHRLVEPTGDIHGSADYRRVVARVLTGRALACAAERAREGGDGG